jgi:peptidyl-prolyl cis-trans isomerase A (cyclophilin A)
MGDIVIEVMTDKAPVSGGDFLRYVKEGLYDGEGFYRIVRSADNHTDGTISLARDEPGTGSAAYFFITVGDQPGLDYSGARNADKQGFAAFGRVVNGMDVVRNIHSVPVDRFLEGEGYFAGQMLKEPVRIVSAEVSE